ncbi:MAG: hypothetical protein HKM07_05045 [Chlamydiae bacterium]|nr:hypothetical protein [Chlamydiota bacterium]
MSIRGITSQYTNIRTLQGFLPKHMWKVSALVTALTAIAFIQYVVRLWSLSKKLDKLVTFSTTPYRNIQNVRYLVSKPVDNCPKTQPTLTILPQNSLSKQIIQFAKELEQSLQINSQWDSDTQQEKVKEIETFLEIELTEDVLMELSDDDLLELQKNFHQMKDIIKKIQESKAWGADNYRQKHLSFIIRAACSKTEGEMAMRIKCQARARLFYDDPLHPSHNEKIHLFGELLNNTKLVVKTISGIGEQALEGDIFGETTWNYLIEIFKDPQKKREESRARKAEDIKSLPEEYVSWVYNPKTRSLEIKQRENFYKGSKATSVSLLPPSGQEHLFTGYARLNVAIAFDLDQCEIKDRYVYRTDNATPRFDTVLSTKRREVVKYPLSIALDSEIEAVLRFDLKCIERFREYDALESVEALRQHLQKKDIQNPYPIAHNEMLASLKKEGMTGIIAVIPEKGASGRIEANASPYTEIDIIMVKLMAISRQKFVLDQLGIDLPIFLQNPRTGIVGFPQADQNALIEQVLSDDNLRAQVVTYMAEYFHADVSTQEIEDRLVAYLNGNSNLVYINC